jgi:hypothetical protein
MAVRNLICHYLFSYCPLARLEKAYIEVEVRNVRAGGKKTIEDRSKFRPAPHRGYRPSVFLTLQHQITTVADFNASSNLARKQSRYLSSYRATVRLDSLNVLEQEKAE